MYTANREQLAECFGQELTTLPGEKRERTLNALAMALTPESWIVLRERLGLTVEQARDEWRFIVKAIFNGGAAQRAQAAARQLFEAVVAQAELARDGRACCAHSRCWCRSRRVPWRTSFSALASGSLPANWRCAAVGEIDQRRHGAAVGEMDRPDRLLDIDAVILDLARSKIAAHRVVVLGRQAMGEAAARAAGSRPRIRPGCCGVPR